MLSIRKHAYVLQSEASTSGLSAASETAAGGSGTTAMAATAPGVGHSAQGSAPAAVARPHGDVGELEECDSAVLVNRKMTLAPSAFILGCHAWQMLLKPDPADSRRLAILRRGGCRGTVQCWRGAVR